MTSRAPATEKWYLLTNRHNLIGMATQGLVCPRWGLAKYYDDLLERTKGHLPLFKEGCSPELCTAVSASGRESYPVLVELAVTSGNAQVVQMSGGTTLRFLDGALPFTSVEMVHFRSLRELEEFRVRTFENFDPGALAATVSEELFSATSSTIGDFEGMCRNIAAKSLTFEDLIVADSILGGLLAAVTFQPADPRILKRTVEGLGRVFEGVVASGPSLTDFAAFLSRAILGSVPSDELSLFTAATGVISRRGGVLDLDPIELLDGITSAVREGEGGSSPEASVEANLAKVRAVVIGDQPLVPFRDGSGLKAAKGLLLFLLRPDPAEVLTWTDEEVGPDTRVRVLSAVYSGLARGFQRYPTSLRGGVSLARLFEAVRCDAVNRLVGSDVPRQTIEGVALTLDAHEDPGVMGHQVSISLKAQEIAVIETRSIDLFGTIASGTEIPNAWMPTTVEIVKRLKWDDVIETLVTGPSAEVEALGNKIQVTLTGKVDVVERIVHSRLLPLIQAEPDRFKSMEALVVAEETKSQVARRKSPKARAKRNTTSARTDQTLELNV
jgi:hypothetical protein